ncbi:PREDICTED: UBN2_3 domain-containing, partial [Prunus dulcis]
MENAIMKGWLIGAMEPGVMNLFIHPPTAKNIWEDASHTYYEGADRSIIYNLSRKAMETKQ